MAGVDTSKSVIEFILTEFAAYPEKQALFFDKVVSKFPVSQLGNYAAYSENARL